MCLAVVMVFESVSGCLVAFSGVKCCLGLFMVCRGVYECIMCLACL